MRERLYQCCRSQNAQDRGSCAYSSTLWYPLQGYNAAVICYFFFLYSMWGNLKVIWHNNKQSLIFKGPLRTVGFLNHSLSQILKSSRYIIIRLRRLCFCQQNTYLLNVQGICCKILDWMVVLYYKSVLKYSTSIETLKYKD